MSSDPVDFPIHSPARLMRLDVLRGVAILIVILHHSVIDASHAGAISWLATPLERIGFSGVDLFFVLSGFLIGGLLFTEILHSRGRKPQALHLHATRFYLRRAFKIWPPYFVFLAYALLKQHRHLGSWSAALHDLTPNFLHIQNYLGTSFWHTWSLAVEEHFYLVLPIVLSLACLGGVKSVGRVVTAATLLALVACGAARFRLNHDLEFRTHLRCDPLLVGVFIAYIYHFHPTPFQSISRYRTVLLAAGLALIAPNLFLDVHSTYTRRIGYTMLAIGYACILIAVLLSPPGAGPLANLLHSRAGIILAQIGTYSYCIYLFHGDLLRLPIAFHIVPRLNHFPTTLVFAVVTSLYILSSIALGALLTWLIEKPSLALRDRLIPRSPISNRSTSSAVYPEVNHVLQ